MAELIENEGATLRSVRGSLNSVMAFAATLLIAWILYWLLKAAKAVAEVNGYTYMRTLMNLSVFGILLHACCSFYERLFSSGTLPGESSCGLYAVENFKDFPRFYTFLVSLVLLNLELECSYLHVLCVC